MAKIKSEAKCTEKRLNTNKIMAINSFAKGQSGWRTSIEHKGVGEYLLVEQRIFLVINLFDGLLPITVQQ